MLIYNYTPDFIFFAGLLCGEGPAKNEFRIQNPEGPEKKRSGIRSAHTHYFIYILPHHTAATHDTWLFFKNNEL